MAGNDTSTAKRDKGMVSKIDQLAKELTADEKANNPRIMSFINLWASSTGGAFDMSEHTFFFQKVNHYAISQLAPIYKAKYGQPLIDNPALREAVEYDAKWWENKGN
ncbi:hypothetical protein [Burkholderia stagnalis]|uniref:hypothetical protein n=1 Tax=Burkholderia stagnalis TaxID=1503054 RepID=UPI000ADD2A1E|nr:hypothetical protein [Burkholderia stagnalis]